MRNIQWVAPATAGAPMFAAIGSWTVSTTQAFVAAPKLTQISPLQLMTNAKDLPAQKYEDLSFVFN
jgi:hypothetical protein